MAATVNDRDLFLAGEVRTVPAVIQSDYEFQGNVTGNLGGVPVEEVIAAAYAPGSGDITADVLSNSATSILMTSSSLFKTTSGNGGVFIGGGGLFGKNTGGTTTFAIDGATGNVAITGTLSATSIIGSTSASSVEQGAAIGSILPAGSGQITLGSAGKLRTGSGTSRVEFGSTGIFGYSGGTQTFGLSSNGAFSLTGGTVGGSVDIAGTLASVIGPGAANGATLTSGSGSLVLGSSDKIKSGSGTAGVFFGSNGLFGRNSSGTTTFAISSSSGAATFAGDITGGANINISGQGSFSGYTLGADSRSYAVTANSSGGAGRGGLFARGSSTVPAITCYGALGQPAMVVQNTSDAGVSISSYTDALELTVAPGNRAINVTQGTSSFQAISTTSTALVTNLNADRLDGEHASTFGRRFFCNSGQANSIDSQFGIYSSVSGVSTSGSTNVITILSVSDERLKDNIKDCKYGLEFINKLTPREFSWYHSPDVKNHGFIAQEVGEIDDVFVVKNPDGSLGIDQYGLIAALTKAVQELSSEVESLKKQIK